MLASIHKVSTCSASFCAKPNLPIAKFYHRHISFCSNMSFIRITNTFLRKDKHKVTNNDKNMVSKFSSAYLHLVHDATIWISFPYQTAQPTYHLGTQKRFHHKWHTPHPRHSKIFQKRKIRSDFFQFQIVFWNFEVKNYIRCLFFFTKMSFETENLTMMMLNF
jgi:hypothetical protein